jgi:hypothetical protein
MESTVKELDELSVSTTIIGENELLQLDLRLFPATRSMAEEPVRVVEIRLERRSTQLLNPFKMANQSHGHPVSVPVVSRSRRDVFETLRQVPIRRSKR